MLDANAWLASELIFAQWLLAAGQPAQALDALSSGSLAADAVRGGAVGAQRAERLHLEGLCHLALHPERACGMQMGIERLDAAARLGHRRASRRLSRLRAAAAGGAQRLC